MMARFIHTFLWAALLLIALALFACAATELRAGESSNAYLPLVAKPLLPLIRRVSVAGDGTQGNSLSAWPSISPDGSYVAFESLATNLVSDDTNEVEDIFVHDRQTGETVRVSVSSTGAQANDSSYQPSISADGRYVAFTSWASNLVNDDTNNTEDIFVRDRQTGETTRVSIAGDGTEGNRFSHEPSISADGRYVAFASLASNLVPGDTNDVGDVFVHDRDAGETTRVSIGSDGTEVDALSAEAAISGDGRFVAFLSFAANLVPGDTNDEGDVFVHDRETGETIRVSVASDGSEANDYSIQPSISGDGRYVAFASWASNLAGDDSNSTWDVFVHDRLAGVTTRVSVASDGTESSVGSVQNAISGDGRTVAFESAAPELAPGDTGIWRDVFVRELPAGPTLRISVAGDGSAGNAGSYQPAISANGRTVAFASLASNLVNDDTNDAGDVFIHDRGPQSP
jgi:Tol biopolymer transport system component